MATYLRYQVDLEEGVNSFLGAFVVACLLIRHQCRYLFQMSTACELALDLVLSRQSLQLDQAFSFVCFVIHLGFKLRSTTCLLGRFDLLFEVEWLFVALGCGCIERVQLGDIETPWNSDKNQL